MLVLLRHPRPSQERLSLGDKDESAVRVLNGGSEPLTITLQPGEELGVFTVEKILGNGARIGCVFPRELTLLRGECAQHQEKERVPQGRRR